MGRDELQQATVQCAAFPFGSDRYREAMQLRELVLRRPLGRQSNSIANSAITWSARRLLRSAYCIIRWKKN